ncbi:hypothetical protein EV356DRAFT_514536 [Viridothelium virens]|uniref:JmjC domain-containing protein n=1 Tax=Viridothelium virens TaxID=1048519 RepID=A0A6A6HBI2_VIRVR|nr:hypothetical protein EV356DRAFT_514536 [Viridothelium virens]
MPASRRRAAFEPISPDFDVRALVEETENFRYVDRISVDMIAKNGMEQFEKLITLHVIVGGKPLIIEGFQDLLDPWTFTPGWLRDNHGDKVENARNLTTKDSLPLTVKHYLNNMSKLTNQYFEKSDAYREQNRQRVYLKDIDCPPVWHEKLKEHIPPILFYNNESTGEVGGPGAVEEPIPNSTGKRMGKGVARAGDLMSSLPQDMRADNMMCYIGHEGTYTPAHREMCASLGHNIMVETSNHVSEDGKPEIPGSSVWFMTESKDRHLVAEYWLSVLGHDIEVENHFAQVVAWKRAPFKTYVVEQRVGDFILIPPLAPHQVWNRGTRTMKAAWNRTTVETLELALHEALPNARMVCRDEQYKNKAMVYYTLQKYSRHLATAKTQYRPAYSSDAPPKMPAKIRQLQKDFKRLLVLFKELLLSEMFNPDGPQEKCQWLPFDSNVTCAYCRGNIFNRFLTCPSCKDMLGHGTEEPYDVCLHCFAMGRSCACISGLKFVEQFKWRELTSRYEGWREQIIALDGGLTDKTPLSLMDEYKRLDKKTLAQVCKEQIKIRPWNDVHKSKELPKEASESEEIEVNDDGIVKKTKKKQSATWLKNSHTCHNCAHRHAKWKMSSCSTCDRWWCYGVLFRGFDEKPLEIMENPRWKCPHCRRICTRLPCRNDARFKPYQPKGTLLGHDTKKVADERSVECLVDFSQSNINWLRESAFENPRDTARLRQRHEEARRAKETDATLDDHYVEDGDREAAHTEADNEPAIDPRLGGTSGAAASVPRRSQNGFVDPSLDDGENFDGGAASTPLPNVSAMLDGARPDDTLFLSPQYPDPSNGAEYDSGYVAPAAVMYRQEPEDGDYEDPSYNYQDGADDDDELYEDNQVNQKRRRASDDGADINFIANKRRKKVDDTQLPKNDATREFMKQKEKKALEEARKQGRYIMFQAAQRGKKKVVMLRINKDKLAELVNNSLTREIQNGQDIPEIEAEENVLLKSDIAPPKVAGPKAGPKTNTKQPKQFRYRVDQDETFGTRKDKRRTTGPDGKPKKRQLQYEEVTVESDEEIDDAAMQLDGASDHRRDADGRRRISSYLAKRHEGNPELPEILPDDWKDRGPSRNRIREAARRQTLPTRAQAGKRPTMRPVRASAGNQPNDISDDEEDDRGDAASTDSVLGPATQNSTLDMSQLIAQQAIARMQEEENLKAKIKAAKWAAGNFDSDSSAEPDAEEDTSAGAETAAHPFPARPMPVKGVGSKVGSSIFDRKGGKKVKIVGATKRQSLSASGTHAPKIDTTSVSTMTKTFRPPPPAVNGANQVRTSGFVPVNRPMVDAERVVQLSDESGSEADSEEVIPAKSVAPVKRGRGRPSLKKQV